MLVGDKVVGRSKQSGLCIFGTIFGAIFHFLGVFGAGRSLSLQFDGVPGSVKYRSNWSGNPMCSWCLVSMFSYLTFDIAKKFKPIQTVVG